MQTRIVTLHPAHMEALNAPPDRRPYFSPDSVGYCLLADGEPVFAGGVVSLGWKRGEVWMLPTPFFHSHVKTCLKVMRAMLPVISETFIRVQATCIEGTSPKLIRWLGFQYEGTLQKFGPNGEPCRMYSRVK